MLARDKELDGVIQSVKSIERHFNRWFHYPYVFLNDGDFSTEFKETITNYTSGPVEFGKIDPSMWGYPDWVNHDVAREGIRKQGDAGYHVRRNGELPPHVSILLRVSSTFGISFMADLAATFTNTNYC